MLQNLGRQLAHLLQRRRLFLAVSLGLALGGLNYYVLVSANWRGDMWLAYCGAQRILTGENPFECPRDGNWPAYPLTTAIVFLPLLGLPLPVASGVMVGLVTGVCAYVLNRPSETWRLLAFISVPLLYAVITAQWAPLFLAAALAPTLYPTILLKPQFGLPIGLMHFTWRRVMLTGVLGLSTFLFRPTWLGEWLAQVSTYDGFIPLLTLPLGPALLLAAWRWRRPEACWLLLTALMPQRLWYDQLLLWVIPRTGWQMATLTLGSWLTFLPFLLWQDTTPTWTMLFLYLPSLGLVFWQTHQDELLTQTTQPTTPST